MLPKIAHTDLKTAALLLGLLLPLARPAQASEFQSHDTIREAARRHILTNHADYPHPPTVRVSRLDSRLSLSACNKPLETFSAPGSRKLGRTTVGVRCNGDKPWSLYVTANVSVKAKIVVAATDLPRGTLLSAQDLTLVEHDLGKLHQSYLEDPAEAIGKTLKRELNRDEILNPFQISAPLAVKRGSPVMIIANNGALQVRARGTALSNGVIGERIRVLNKSSNRELEVTVISPGVAEIVM